MNGLKKLISCILVVSFLLGIVPPSAFAEEAQTTETDTSTDTSVEGSNTVGTLLADEIENAQQVYLSSYDGSAVTDLTVTDQIATVTYSLQEDAVLVVGIYSEDGNQLLTSSKCAIAAGNSIATVTFAEELPAYFYISAYILDPETNAPLCQPYRNPMYTQNMQQLLASTVDDYDPELVLNLDHREDTNFLVFSEDSVSIPASDNINAVVSANDETCTYVIENADSSFTSLSAGQVVRYPYGDDQMLILKVGSISVNGTTVTLTGTRPEVEEIFQVVKLEASATTEDCEIDPTYCSPGITYVGDAASPATRASGSESIQETFPFEIDPKELEANGFSISISGSINITVDANIDYYLTTADQYIRFASDLGVEAELAVTGKYEWNPQLFKIGIPILGILNIGIKGDLKMEGQVSASISAKYTQTIGFIYDNGSRTNLSTSPEFSSDSSIDASLTIGLSVGIYIDLLYGLAEVSLSAGVDFTILAKLITGGPTTSKGRVHYCSNCIDVDVDLTFNVTLGLKLIWGVVDKDFTLVELSKRLCDLYYSFDLQQGGKGVCPNQDPQLVIKTFSAKGTPIWNAQAEITAGDKTYNLPVVFGFSSLYLPIGDVSITVTDSDGRQGSASIYLTESQVVEVFLDYHGNIGTDIYWRLSADGTLSISGEENSLLPVYEAGGAPWDKYGIPVTDLRISNCTVSADAFKEHKDLRYLTASHCNLESDAFSGCPQLISIEIYGENVLAENVFADCINLHYVYLAHACAIGSRAFANCTSLTSIKLPRNTTAGTQAFADCTQLSSVYTSGDVHFEADAFEGCSGLKAVEAPELSDWLSNSFAEKTANPLYYAHNLYLNNQLVTELSLDHIQAVPNYAFAGCTSLTGLIRLSSITAFGEESFYGCTGLTTLELPETLTQIASNAFASCTGLTDVYFYGDPPAIADNAFTGVTANAYYLDYSEAWFSEHLHGYGGNLTWDTFRKPIDSGIYGEITWKVTGDYILIIDGEGAIPDFEANGAPWSEYADQITAIIIKDGITQIGKYSFRSFKALTSVTLPDSVIKLGAYAFEYCSQLEQLTLPSKLQYIGDRCFANTNLQYIALPASVKTIGVAAFNTANGGTVIDISDVAAWCGISFGSYPLYGESAAHNQLYLNGAPVSALVIPDTVTAIPANAFAYLTADTVVLGSNVQTIGDYAFYQSSVNSIALNNDLTTIGESAFSGSALQSVNIPGSVTSIGGYAFSGCAALTTASVASTSVIPSGAFSRCTGLTQVTLGDGVTHIANNAFEYCNSLTLISFGSTLETIAYQSFCNCTALTTLVFPASLNKIYTNSFEGCNSLTEIYFSSENPPTIYNYNWDSSLPYRLFEKSTATIYYPRTGDWIYSDTWDLFGSDTKHVSWNPTSTTSIDPVAAPITVRYTPTVRMASDMITEYYTDLDPAQEYLFVVVVNEDAPDLMSNANLLYIDQGTAAADGTLSFSYLPNGVTGYPLIFGGGKLDLGNAQVEFTEMTVPENEYLVEPTVTLNDTVLTQGVDYTLSGDLVVSSIGTFELTVQGIGQYCGTVDCTYRVINESLALVTATDRNGAFATLTQALGATDSSSFVQLQADIAEDLTVAQDAWLDLNGFTLTGDVTIADGAVLYVFDTATADYTSESRGKLIGTVTGKLSRTAKTPAASYGSAYRYLTLLEEEHVYSFHRIYLGIHTAVLTPHRDYGDYTGTAVNYKAVFKCSDMVAQYVTAYGADFSLHKTVSLDFLASQELKSGPDNLNERKTSLTGTLRSTNTDGQNSAYALMKPEVQVYIRLSDGLEEQVNAPLVSLSLKDVVTMANSMTTHTRAQKTALGDMYHLHKGFMSTWGNSVSMLQSYAKYYSSYTTYQWVMPCQYTTISSPFGYRVHPVYGNMIFHNGIDLSGTTGTPIYAVLDGTVIRAGFDSSLGYYVEIDHGNGFVTRYQHMTHYVVSVGQTVSAGQVIGYMGSTGAATAPHLHLSFILEGKYVNPADFLDFS